MSTTGLLFVLGLGLTACGQQSSEEHSALQAEGAVAQTYQEWCTDWQLNCPVTDPGKTNTLSAAQFKALSTILGSALSSPSVFGLNRQDLDSANLQQAMTALHLEDVYQDIHARLDASQWQSSALQSGSLVSQHSAATTQEAGSGLVFNVDAQQQISFTEGAIKITGLGFASGAGARAASLESYAVADNGNFNVGLSDRTVQDVPQAFALDNLLLAFGLDTSKLDGKKIELPDIIAAGSPLVSWLNQSSRQLTLEHAFFETTAGQLGILLPEDNMGQSLGNLLSRFDKLRTSADSKNNMASVTLVKGATAKCDVNNGDVKVKFASEFGVKRVYPVNATTLGLEFYGVEAAAKKALGISIKLKRVELSGDKITILDVPIIGKVDVKLSDIANPDQKTTLVCGA